jgi:hypothetical protein
MGNVVWSGSSIVMLAVCLCGGAATADDSTDLGSKFDAALSAVKSYQVDVTRGDRRSTTVFVHGVGSRYQSTSSLGDTTVYTVGTTIYQQLPGMAGWHKVVIDRDDAAMFAKSATRRRAAEPLPDRTEDGVTVGAVRTTVTMVFPGMNPETITMGPGVCTYDKSTLLFRTCTFDHGTFSYSHYDDPSLTIELPAEAKNAPETHLPLRPASQY